MTTAWIRIASTALVLVLTGSSHADEDFRLRTEDTVLVVRHSGERIGCVRFGPADSSWNWIRGVEYCEPVLPRVVDGQRQPIAWRLASVQQNQDDAGQTVTAQFAADAPRLEMNVVWKACSGPGPIEQTIRVVNHSPGDVTLGAMPCLAWSLQAAPDAALEHRWVEKGAGTPPTVGTHVTPIDAGFQHRGVSSPHANKKESGEAIPWQCVHDRTHRHGWYTVIASSAHVAQQVEAVGDGTLGVTLGFDEQVAPLVILVRSGGEVTFPPVLVGCYQGSIDDGCNRLHRWAERWNLPPSNDERLPLLVNNTWGSRLDVSPASSRKMVNDSRLDVREANCRAMIDDAAALGFEMFHIDAGWYRAVGDWRPDPVKFPGGLRPISDYAHEKGLKFGLWVAWAQGGHVVDGPSVLSVFGPGMRQWFPTDMPDNWKAKQWSGETCCLGSPAARRWCLDELRRIIRQYNLDMLEHDQPMISWNCRRDHDHTASPLDAGRNAAEGYYEIYDTLRREFPDLLFEDCVNGGCTVDYGIMRRCHYVSATDTYDPLANRKAFYDASFPLPPRAIEAYMADEYPRATRDNFSYMLRSAMLGWCTVMVDTMRWTPQEHEIARRQFEIYKNQLRPLIRDGNLYHVSPRPTDSGWDAYQYHAAKQGRGAVLVFRAKSPSAQECFKLDGLQPDAEYELQFEDYDIPPTVTTGQALMRDGLSIHLPTEESSQIVYLEAKR